MFFKNNENIFLNIIISALTVGIFFFIFKNIDFEFFVKEIKKINFFWLLIAYLFLIFPKLLVAFRWKILISDYKKINLKESLKLQFVMDTFSLLIPLKMGDFINAFYSNDEKYSPKVGISASVFEKIVDIFFIFIFAIIGAFYFWKDSVVLMFIFSMSTLFLIAILLFLIKIKKNVFFSKLIKKIKLLRLITKQIKEFFLYFLTIKENKKKIAMIFIISLISWVLLIFQSYFIFKAVSIDVNLMVLFGAISIGTLITIVPVTFLGMGTRDAVFIFLFNPFIAYTNIVLFGILFTIRYVMMAIFGLFWMNEIIGKIKIKN